MKAGCSAAAVYAALLISAVAAAAQPQPAPRVESVQVISSGFSGPGRRVKRSRLREVFSRGPVMIAQVGTEFRMTVRPLGRPDGAEVTLRWVWRAPQPIGVDSDTGKATREIVEQATVRIGQAVRKSFRFQSVEQIVKGTWRAEVWSGQRRLAVRRFGIR
jgi:hypothetical protein